MYLYCLNDPLNAADASGLQEDDLYDNPIDGEGRPIFYKKTYGRAIQEVDRKVLTPLKTAGAIMVEMNPLSDLATLCESPSGRAKMAAALGLLLATVPADNVVKELAAVAAKMVGKGKGAAWGTRVHTALRDLIRALDRKDINPEVSYLNGRVVKHGTKGSIRVDVVVGDPANPIAIYDLKTGSAKLTARRILDIRKHLPKGCDPEIYEIRL